jgi:hypothetical protein
MNVSFNATAGFIAAFVFVHAVQAADANQTIPPVSNQEAATLLSGTACSAAITSKRRCPPPRD